MAMLSLEQLEQLHDCHSKDVLRKLERFPNKNQVTPALWMFVFNCLYLFCLPVLTGLQLSPGLADGVPNISQFLCLPVRLVLWGSPSVCLHLPPFMWFQVWLMVSGSSICLLIWLVMSRYPDAFQVLLLLVILFLFLFLLYLHPSVVFLDCLDRF